MDARADSDAAALFADGNRRLRDGDNAGAAACFRRLAALSPALAAAHGNLGLALDALGEDGPAEAAYRRARELDPDSTETHLNLGALLLRQKRLIEAEAAARQAVLLRPAAAAGWSNLGAVCACLGRDDEAEQCYRTATALDAGHAHSRFNLGCLLLRQGRFEEGWQCLEARDWYAALAARIDRPRWQGEPLAGRSLLIGCEAGHGDMIQFCRYVDVVRHWGAGPVGLVCQPALKTLLATLDGVDRVIGYDEAIAGAEWDCWSPALSLPHLCGTRLETIPARLPYLRVPAAHAAQWAAASLGEGLRVGLVWQGNPRFENDAERSLPSLATLAPLAELAGIDFVSLQKGAGEDEAAAPPAGMTLRDYGGRLADFADTAALVARLDLVIAVDTAVAHLAGALGIPCWLLLPAYLTDWRWLRGRDDSPWYPGVVRLFRQRTIGNWDEVVAQVRAALADRVAADIRRAL